MSDLRVSASVSVEARQAEGELNRLNSTVSTTRTGLDRVTVSAGQSRAAMANLGQQVGDISQGFALGISPMTIFAQQAGQVGFAMSGLGGKVGAVGAFLSGPWGAAVTGAAIVLGSLWQESQKAAEKEDEHAAAAKTLRGAIDDLDKATGRYNLSQRETIRIKEIAIKQEYDEAIAKRVSLRAELDRAQANLDATNRAGVANPFGSFNVGRRSKAVEDNEKAIVDAQASQRGVDVAKGLDQVAAANDKVAAATQAHARAVDSLKAARLADAISQAEFKTGLAAADRDLKAATDGVKDAAKAARDTQAEHNKELREAERAATAYAQSLESIRIAASRGTAGAIAIGAGGVGIGLKERLDQTSSAERDASGLGRIVSDIEARLPQAGAAAAKAFTAGTLADAAVIGQAIGGGVGRAFTSIAALGFGKDGRDLTGSGARLETLLKPLTDTFGNGGKRIAGLIGTAAGGAATGSVISGIGDALGIKNSKVGASIGGALGGLTGIPGGELIGSILGGLAGNLIGVKKGSTTISASGGAISSSSTGNAAVQKATGAIGNTITDALTAIADQLGGTVGDFSVSIGKRGDQFRVDRSGTGKLNGGTVTGTASESEAISLAIADALKDGAVKTSPRVQAALLRYSDNVNKAVAEALKVKGLEDLIADRGNPFLATFRTLETQLKQRIDVARANGFDLVAIEKINGEDRAKALKDTLAAATGSVRNLLTELTIGSGATGSATQRLAGLATERDRLAGLAKAGDGSQLDALASIIKQIDDLQRETFGSTGGFAAGRADSVALLNDLIRQTEEKAKAAADQARGVAQTTVDKLTELNATGDDTVLALATSNALLGQIAASLQTGVSTGNFALANEYARGAQ